MKKQNLGKIILLGIMLAILTAVFETEMSYQTSESLFVISGLIMLVFGSWGAIELIKDKNNG